MKFVPIEPDKLPAIKERFLKSIQINENGCWLWTKTLSMQKYGMFYYAKRAVLAHRVSYALFVGELPEILDHMCHTQENCVGGLVCLHRRCVNPKHLQSSTNVENIRRGCCLKTSLKRMAAITHCPRGHEYTPENTRVHRRKRHCKTCSRAAFIKYYYDFKEKHNGRTP